MPLSKGIWRGDNYEAVIVIKMLTVKHLQSTAMSLSNTGSSPGSQLKASPLENYELEFTFSALWVSALLHSPNLGSRLHHTTAYMCDT